jgi:putative CocE/NonD family hydrolase
MFFVCSCLFLPVGSAVWAQQYEVTVEHNVAVQMRDGVTLRADIYRPKDPGKFPVLLARTPYNKDHSPVFDPTFGKLGAAKGYVVILQDVRGRFTSDGQWYPFKFDAQDGYDTIEWAAALPYSDGQVGMVGSSYLGYDQLLAAITRPPHLKGIFPIIAPSNLYSELVHQGGALNQWVVEDWTTAAALVSLLQKVPESMNVKARTATLPITSYPILGLPTEQQLAPFFYDWLKHPSYDEYWRQWAVDEDASKITVPAFLVDGWYDIFLNGAIENYESIKSFGGSDNARQNVRLLIGPWYHGPFNVKVGDVDFGPESKIYGLQMVDLIFRWYDHLLKGEQNGVDSEKSVTYFVMGKNQWQQADTWPPQPSHQMRFYLQSKGNANSLQGDGELVSSDPGPAAPDHYIYDPADPVPTTGGATCCDKKDFVAGAFDQRDVEARKDVLVYSTPVFKEDFVIAGPVRADLYASSSAKDTDFTAKLVDVWPNGFVQNLTEGILRARYRNSRETPELMQPGTVYKFSIDLWATSDDFLPGHRLRVEISSSNFPHFSRNLNTGNDLADDATMIKATNTVYHGAEQPSALVVTVLDAAPQK